MKHIDLDAESRVITKDGIQDFFYPVSRKTHLDFSIDMMKSYTGVVSKYNEDVDIDLYKILAKYYISEVVAVFQGLLLKEALLNKSYDYNIPKEWQIWPSLFENKAPRMPKYINSFIKGAPKPKYTKKIFNINFIKLLLKIAVPKGSGVNIDGLKIKPITSKVLNNDIIATQRTALIIEHAKEVDKDVVFCSSTKWFNSINDKDIISNYKLSQIDLDILKATREILVKYNLELPDHIEQYFIEIIKASIVPFKAHLDILAKASNLPKNLWIGTSGNIWDCLLKIAVKRNEGYVCGHDHGTGQSHLITPLMGIIELWGSDEFYTFTDELANAAPHWSLMDGNMISVIKGKNKKTISHKSNYNNEIKSIFLLSTIYDKDRGRMHPLTPDITQIDWQARFVNFLKNKNYDITIKSHPESSFPVPKIFETELDAKINSDRFENVYKTADMFIFDYICTSTFKDAIKTNIPIIIIDFNDVTWTDKAYSLIIKRCSFIKGYYDENNRAQIEWDKFTVSVNKAIKRSANSEFYNSYYG